MCCDLTSSLLSVEILLGEHLGSRIVMRYACYYRLALAVKDVAFNAGICVFCALICGLVPGKPEYRATVESILKTRPVRNIYYCKSWSNLQATSCRGEEDLPCCRACPGRPTGPPDASAAATSSLDPFPDFTYQNSLRLKAKWCFSCDCIASVPAQSVRT